MDDDHPLKIIVNVHRQCGFASIIVNIVNTWRKSMNLQGGGIDGDRQSPSSINIRSL
jgi:hypothetical protein